MLRFRCGFGSLIEIWVSANLSNLDPSRVQYLEWIHLVLISCLDRAILWAQPGPAPRPTHFIPNPPRVNPHGGMDTAFSLPSQVPIPCLLSHSPYIKTYSHMQACTLMGGFFCFFYPKKKT